MILSNAYPSLTCSRTTLTSFHVPGDLPCGTIICSFFVFLVLVKIFAHNLCFQDVFEIILTPFQSKRKAIRQIMCCPKRRARYWKCAKRRRQCTTEVDICPFSRLFKIHLPAPLPFLGRCQNRANQECDCPKKESHATESNDADTYEITIEPSAAAAASEIIHKRPHRPQPHLIDMVRMQQWQGVLDLPSIQRREAKYRDADGLYPLHWAAAGGATVPVLQNLLNAYPSAIRKVDSEGSTVLHFAACYSASYQSVAMLMKVYPKAVTIQDKYGRIPLYHAAEKSAGLDVLKLLSEIDLSTITTPCFTSTKMSPQNGLTREEAVRTPLYLVWAAVVLDHRSRTTRRGKKWEKAVWMLQASYLHHSSRCDNLLSAAVTMDIFLPEQVPSLVVSSYPEFLSVPNSLGELPLATAARTSYTHGRFKELLSLLLSAYPNAAYHRNAKTGRSVLHEAIESSQPVETLHVLLSAAPEAVEWREGKSGLPPALYAALPRPSQTSTTNDEQAIMSPEKIDPFNLLSSKQRDIIQQKHQQNTTRGTTSMPTEAGHLDSIYMLLQTNPTQIAVFT